jgi:single-stranded-DNA-specific exonuclease
VPSFDLHGALAACSGHLRRFGGHRAAAGLSIETEHLEAFAQAFAAQADLSLDDGDLVPATRVDAIVPGRDLTLPLAAELQRLAPFGLGNPDVTLLVPSCEAVGPALVGEGKHLRFRVRQRGRDAGSAIGFGLGGQLDRLRRTNGQGPVRYDVACRLKENHWNGTVAPQLVIRRLFDAPDGYEELRERLAGLWRAGEEAWTDDARAVFEELELGQGVRRELYESEAFRALLASEPAFAVAA